MTMESEAFASKCEYEYYQELQAELFEKLRSLEEKQDPLLFEEIQKVKEELKQQCGVYLDDED